MLLLLFSVTPAVAQSLVDTVSGRVVNAAGAHVAGAEVVVTPLGGAVSSATRTDSAGRFQVTLGAADQYLVVARAADGSSARVNVTRSLSGRTEVEITLSAATTLAPVSVTARRVPPPSRIAPDFGQSEETVQLGSSYPGITDDANVLANLIDVPGVEVTRDGAFSVLGLAGAQNRMTFNGASVQSLVLPKLTPVFARVATTSYDVSRGGFSGGLLSVEPQNTSNYVISNLAVSVRHPALESRDRRSELLGTDERHVRFDFSRMGPIVWDRLSYSMSGHVRRTTQPAVSLNRADAGALQTIGITAGALAGLLAELNTAGVSTAVPGDPSSAATNELALFGRLDLIDANSRRLSLTTTGSHTRSDQLSVGPTAAASRAMHSRNHAWSVQVGEERRIRTFMLNEFRAAYSQSATSARPLVALPSGAVMLGDGGDGTDAVPVYFGGPFERSRSNDRRAIDLSNSISWHDADQRHLLKLSVEAQAQRLQSTRAGPSLGEYRFHSVEDLAAGQPSEFVRELAPVGATGDFHTVAFAFGDKWQPRPTLEIMYGLRADAFRADPDFSTETIAAAGALGVSQANSAWLWGLSPRAGFVRTVTPRPARPGTVARRWTVSGGSGVFRATDAQVVAAPLTRAGWSSTGRVRLQCIGESVPKPDWTAFTASTAAIPSACAGLANTPGDSSAPLALLDSRFRPPYSWRTNLAVSTRIGPMRVGVEGILSRNVNQPTLRDANHLGTERFGLLDEGMRPVFIQVEEISADGALRTTTGRRNQRLGPAWVLSSDVESLSRQAILRLGPATWSPLARGSWQASWVISSFSEERRGFESSTGGDPAAIERIQGAFQPRHQFTVRASRHFGSTDAIELSGFVRASSGFRFTPLVASDINGDGAVNDRAWIFDPQAASDPELGRDLSDLLAHGSPAARACLRSQLGKMSRAQSCTGPRNVLSSMNLRIRGGVLRLPARSAVTLHVTNPLGPVDRLLHGSSGRGWGSVALADPYLFTVRGFDSHTQRFAYVVNPQFGSAVSPRSISGAPTRVSISVFVPIGPTIGAQVLESSIAPGRWREGERASAELLTDSFVLTVVGRDPLARLGRGRDSVNYTPAQRDAIRTALMLRDSALVTAYRIPAAYAAALGSNPTPAHKRELNRLTEAATDTAELAMVRAAVSIRSVLTADQLDRLPSVTAAYLTPGEIRRMRRRGLLTF